MNDSDDFFERISNLEKKLDEQIERLNKHSKKDIDQETIKTERMMNIKYIYDPADSPENDYMESILTEILRSFDWYPYVSGNSNINRNITFQRLYIPEREKIREKQQSFLKLFLKMTKENIFE